MHGVNELHHPEADQHDHTTEKPVFNRVLDLKDSFKPEKK